MLAIMPRPVMAAALLFIAVFIMIGGVQIISTRVLDGRRTLVIGMGIMSFVAMSVYPAAFTACPPGRSRSSPRRWCSRRWSRCCSISCSASASAAP